MVPEYLRQIRSECVAKVSIDEKIIDLVTETMTLPQPSTTTTHNEKYKEYLTCIYRKQGYQSADGQIQLDKIKDFLKHYYKNDLLAVLNPCGGIETDGVSNGDKAFRALECILPKLKLLKTSNDYD